jgi:hypothetical protein
MIHRVLYTAGKSPVSKPNKEPPHAGHTTVDPAEVAKFEAMASRMVGSERQVQARCT